MASFFKGMGFRHFHVAPHYITSLVASRKVPQSHLIAVLYRLEYLTLFFAGYDVRFTVLHPDEGKTPEQELTDDLIATLTSFSGRFYGMRSHKQKEIAARIEEVLHTS